MASLNPGTILDKRFHLIEKIGKGGMGTVWLACDLTRDESDLDYHVAVKVLSDAMVSQLQSETMLREQGLNRDAVHQNIVGRFVREGKLLSGLEHRNIARFIASGQTEAGSPYLVIEYLSGKTLEDELWELREARGLVVEEVDGEGRPCQRAYDFSDVTTPRSAPLMSYESIFVIMTELLYGLQYLHNPRGEFGGEGITHRDLKPANIMFEYGEDGLPTDVKLLDFGIAKVANKLQQAFGSQTTYTVAHSVIGTPNYMSPEQLQNPKTVGPRTDVYAAGVILFEMLTGIMPYASSQTPVAVFFMIGSAKEPLDPGKYVQDVPRRLRDVVMKATHPKEDDRYANAHAFLGDFTRAKLAAQAEFARRSKTHSRTSTVSEKPTIASDRPPPIHARKAAPSGENVETSSDGSFSSMIGGLAIIAILGVIGFFAYTNGYLDGILQPKRGSSIQQPVASISTPAVQKNAPSSRVSRIDVPASSLPVPHVTSGVTRRAEPLSVAAQIAFDLGVDLKGRDCRAALRSFENAKTSSPNSPEIYEQMAFCHRKLGQQDLALQAESEARSLRGLP